MVGRGPDRDLADNPGAGWIKHLHAICTSYGDVEPFAVWAEGQGTRRLIQRHLAALGLVHQVQHDDGGGTLLLGTDIRGTSVWTDDTVVRLWHGDLAHDPVAGGIDQYGLITAEAGHEYLPTVRGDGQSVGCWANLDAADHAVAGSVNDAHCRSAIATDVDLAAVWRHDQAVWARRHCNGVQHAVSSGIEHGDGLVFEEPDVGLAHSRGRRCVRRAGRGWRRCQGLHHQQQE